MLGAVMFGHRHFQPVIEAIIRLAEKAAKEPREVQQADNTALEKEMLALVEPDLRAAYGIRNKKERHDAVDAAKAKAMAHFCPDGAEPAYSKQQIGNVFKESEAKIVRWNILDTGRRIDGRDVQDGAPDRVRGRRAAARPWLGSVHPRRDAGAGRCHARHRRGRAVDRCATRAPTRKHSSCTTTSRHSRSARPAAWADPAGARSATASSPGAPSIRFCRRNHEFPYTHARRLGDHRIERLVLHGDGVRHLARADGRRRAAQAADRRHRHGSHPGGASAMRCSPTSSATRTISATWTSRWPAPSAA